MRPLTLLGLVGLSLKLTVGVVIADEPATLPQLGGSGQPAVPVQPTTPTPPKQPSTPPQPITPPPTSPTTPPLTTAPVASNLGQGPQSSTFAGAGFVPFMMGDLGAGSYVKGLFSFPTLVRTDVVVTPPPSSGNPNPRPQIQTIVRPGQEYRVALLPQVARGGVNIDENESPRPVDRVFFTYNYFNNIGNAVPTLPQYDLHREMYGFELTYWGGDASIGLRMNSLQTTGNSSLASGDFGDLTVISKFALINNRDTNNVLSVGLAVTAPTGPTAHIFGDGDLNSVLLQPWGGFIYNFENAYVQGFSSLIIPTDSRDVSLANNAIGAGYWLYRSCDPSSFVSFVAPIVEGHWIASLNHQGLDSSPVGFPSDVVVITSGVHIGLGRSANLALGAAVPVTGPKVFDIEALAQLNWKF